MTDAPERIWARDVAPYGLDDLELGCWWHKPEYGDEVEYIRADLYDNTALKAAADMMADEHGWVRRERLDALTEQLEAARADAKEAEAYAEELAKDQVDLCRQLIAAEDKLAKAMELVTFASNMDVTDWSEALDVKDQARTTLAEIEGGKDD